MVYTTWKRLNTHFIYDAHVLKIPKIVSCEGKIALSVSCDDFLFLKYLITKVAISNCNTTIHLENTFEQINHRSQVPNELVISNHTVLHNYLRNVIRSTHIGSFHVYQSSVKLFHISKSQNLNQLVIMKCGVVEIKSIVQRICQILCLIGGSHHKSNYRGLSILEIY